MTFCKLKKTTPNDAIVGWCFFIIKTPTFTIWYNSDTFARLQNEQTGFYYQSSGYVYSFLQNEMQLGIVA